MFIVDNTSQLCLFVRGGGVKMAVEKKVEFVFHLLRWCGMKLMKQSYLYTGVMEDR